MSAFAKRIDALPLERITIADLLKRIACLNSELRQLEADAEHVDTQCRGMEKFRRMNSIIAERTAAAWRRTIYTLELESRERS